MSAGRSFLFHQITVGTHLAVYMGAITLLTQRPGRGREVGEEERARRREKERREREQGGRESKKEGEREERDRARRREKERKRQR